MQIQEGYIPKAMAASGALFAGQGTIGGFLCTTAGNVQIRETNAGGAIVVASFAVVVGGWYPIPFSFGNGAYADLTGGAVGTFGLAT